MRTTALTPPKNSVPDEEASEALLSGVGAEEGSMCLRGSSSCMAGGPRPSGACWGKNGTVPSSSSDPPAEQEDVPAEEDSVTEDVETLSGGGSHFFFAARQETEGGGTAISWIRGSVFSAPASSSERTSSPRTALSELFSRMGGDETSSGGQPEISSSLGGQSEISCSGGRTTTWLFLLSSSST